MRTVKEKKPFLFSMLIFILVFSVIIVPVAQAREPGPSEGWEPTVPDLEVEEKEIAQAYDPAAFQAAWGISPDMLIDCDPNANLLGEVSPGSVQGYHKLQSSACSLQASQEAALSTSTSLAGSCGYSGVSGESRMMKISGYTTDVRYVFIQCGKKVGVIEPPTCSCAGNFRYTYDCKKPPTVYITLPCNH